MENRLTQLKYNQIRLNILDYIANQGLQVGDRLPPERTFTQMLNCSSGTMRIALHALEENGLIEKRHGMGSYLKRKVTDMVPTGSVLYVTVVANLTHCSYPPRHLHSFFARRSLHLEHISVTCVGDIPKDRLENCQGLILTGWLTMDLLQNFKALGLPLIILGNNNLPTDIPVVSVDMPGIAHRLTRHFVDLGRTRIAFWGGEPDYMTLHEAQLGYESAMSEAGLQPLIMEWNPTPPCQRLSAFLHQNTDVEVMIAEQLAFMEYGMVKVENPEFPLPQFGMLPLLPSGHYTQGRNIIFGDFQQDMAQVAAQQLCDTIASQTPMKSIVIPPVLHGFDDDYKEFDIL